MIIGKERECNRDSLLIGFEDEPWALPTMLPRLRLWRPATMSHLPTTGSQCNSVAVVVIRLAELLLMLKVLLICIVTVISSLWEVTWVTSSYRKQFCLSCVHFRGRAKEQVKEKVLTWMICKGSYLGLSQGKLKFWISNWMKLGRNLILLILFSQKSKYLLCFFLFL